MAELAATLRALLLALFVLFVLGDWASAQTRVVEVGSPVARMSLLKAGTHRYLRYEIRDGKRTAHDIWSRAVSFEQKDGARRLHITQRWDEINVARQTPPPRWSKTAGSTHEPFAP